MDSDSLVILPTAMGKTIIAALVIAEYINQGKVLLLVPQKPLLIQHRDTFYRLLEGVNIVSLSGDVKPESRSKLFSEGDLIIATPQTVKNDLENGRYNLDEASLVIFDEAHRAVGNYAYVDVARYCHKNARRIGFTASPSSEASGIREVCSNLGITRLDARDYDDPDVRPYVKKITVNDVVLNLPKEISDISGNLKSLMSLYAARLNSLGFKSISDPPSASRLCEILDDKEQARDDQEAKMAMIAKTIASAALKVNHAIILAETEGLSPLRKYLQSLSKEEYRSSEMIFSTEEYQSVKTILDTTKVEHPKISKTMSLVSMALGSSQDSRVIVFAQFRDTCDLLQEKLSLIDSAKVCKLVGQAGKGMNGKKQAETMDGFRTGEFNVMVCTSVAEEGLDIPEADTVIFYEPVPSAIRSIQRQGRTGRKDEGTVHILIAKDSNDESSLKISRVREHRMRMNIEKVGRELEAENKDKKVQRNLDGF